MMRRSIAGLVFALTSFVVPVHAQICTPFTDVSAQDPFCDNIQWMYNRGVTLGCTTTAYCPAQFVRRDQMAAFMNRLNNVVFAQGGSAFGATAVMGTTDSQPLHIRVNGNLVMRYEPAIIPNVIGGHAGNAVHAGVHGATIAGGGATGASPGYENRVSNHHGFVGGGYGNQAGEEAVVGGGEFNAATGYGSTVSGGDHNDATGKWASIIGGRSNIATGIYSSVLGGAGNWAGADRSVVLGTRALVLPAAVGSFVFADSTQADFASHGPNQFLVAASGGVGLYTSKAGTTYCRIDAGGGSWNCSSSRAVKRDFAPVDTRDALEKVASLSLASWRFVNEPEGVRHMGPMAEEFRAAFGLGSDERSISSVDAQGVALAAIQGLNAKLEQRLRATDAELAELRRTVEWLVRSRTLQRVSE
jgi:Chaperone of endosialidase